MILLGSLLDLTISDDAGKKMWMFQRQQARGCTQRKGASHRQVLVSDWCAALILVSSETHWQSLRRSAPSTPEQSRT